jgi:large subunit ribosomal protein L15
MAPDEDTPTSDERNGAAAGDTLEAEADAEGSAEAGADRDAEAEAGGAAGPETARAGGGDAESDKAEAEEAERLPRIIRLHHLRPAERAKKRKIRVGRGEGGRRGKTAGRGTKGQKARSNTRPGFEGGQMPLHRRVPKLKGFKNPFRVEFNVVNLSDLAAFDAGATVDPDVLRSKGMVHHKGLVKVLGGGDLDKALTVRAHAFSKSAAQKITAAGGSAEVV